MPKPVPQQVNSTIAARQAVKAVAQEQLAGTIDPLSDFRFAKDAVVNLVANPGDPRAWGVAAAAVGVIITGLDGLPGHRRFSGADTGGGTGGAARRGKKTGQSKEPSVPSSKSIPPKAQLRYKLKPQDADWRGTGKGANEALEEAFKQTGRPKSDFKVTKWGKDKYGKSHPVEWRTADGAEVNIDWPHTDVGWKPGKAWETGPDAPHVGWQTPGKRISGGAQRGHIILDDVPYNR